MTHPISLPLEILNPHLSEQQQQWHLLARHWGVSMNNLWISYIPVFHINLFKFWDNFFLHIHEAHQDVLTLVCIVEWLIEINGHIYYLTYFPLFVMKTFKICILNWPCRSMWIWSLSTKMSIWDLQQTPHFTVRFTTWFFKSLGSTCLSVSNLFLFTMISDFISILCLNIIPLCVCMFVYTTLYPHSSIGRSFLFLGYCTQCCNEHRSANGSLIYCFHFLCVPIIYGSNQ